MLTRYWPHISGARANEFVAGVLLQGVTDPADGSPQGKEGDGRSGGQVEGLAQRHQAEIQGGMVSQQGKSCVADGVSQGEGPGVGVGLDERGGAVRGRWSPSAYKG